MRVYRPCLAIAAQYHRGPLEGAEHEGHPVADPKVGSGFVATAGDIQPEYLLAGQYPQRVTTLGRDVDSALRRGSANEEQSLRRDTFPL